MIKQRATSRLVVTADDFGLSPGVDRGIIEAFRRGIVRSTALFVNFPEVADSVARLRQEPDLEVGIHLNLTVGSPVLPAGRVPSLVNENGKFHSFGDFFARVALSQIDWGQVNLEWQAQLERGMDLGCTFTFITSHRHVHMLPQLARICGKLAHKFRIDVVRLANFQIQEMLWEFRLKTLALSPFVHAAKELFEQDSIIHNDSTVEIPSASLDRALQRVCGILKRLDGRVHELVCHPGHVDSLLKARDPYVVGRASELAVLMDSRLHSFLETSGIELTTFREVAASTGQTNRVDVTKLSTEQTMQSVPWSSLFAWARVLGGSGTVPSRRAEHLKGSGGASSPLPPKIS